MGFEVKRVMVFHLADVSFPKGGQDCQEARVQVALNSGVPPSPDTQPAVPRTVPGSRSAFLRAHFEKWPQQTNSPTCRLPGCENPAGRLWPGRAMKSAGQFPGMAGDEGNLWPPGKEPKASSAQCKAGKVGRAHWVAVLEGQGVNAGHEWWGGDERQRLRWIAQGKCLNHFTAV